jgi:hypothetical protein
MDMKWLNTSVLPWYVCLGAVAGGGLRHSGYETSRASNSRERLLSEWQLASD